MASSEHTHGHSCDCPSQYPSVVQTLDEMDFERGIWGAAVDGDVAKVERLLDKGTHVESRDSLGYSALHYSARHNRGAICKLLISRGADVNGVTRSGQTALHRAAGCGHGQIVELLLDARADVVLADSDGKTALHKAAENRRAAACALLVRKKPDLVGMKDNLGRTALDYAADPEVRAALNG